MAARTERIIPSTRRRVRRHTDESVNRKVDDQIARNVRYFSVNRDEIDDRLEELDQEWDIERMIETNASALALAGTALGASVNKKFLVLPLMVTAFLLQHAVQGWCPPVPILRRFGFRTQDEINTERYALKALRGDFDALAKKTGPEASANAALRAVNG